jgi:pilus assembly protein CpaB
MARRRGPLLLVMSLVLAALSAWLANDWLSARAAAKPAQEQVVTAAMDIPLGTKIEQRHLSMISMLPGSSPKGAFHDYTEVLGKVTSSSVISGEMLLAARLADSGEGSALAAVVDKDMRAVTVRVDDVVGVAGFLLPGNRVDVIATVKELTSNQAHATTILSNVKVLAVDQTASSDSNQPVIVRAVTLEVSPSDAEILLKGKTAGAIQLTLRNPLDESDARTRQEPAPVKVAAIRPKTPAEAPRPVVHEITVIRGTQVAHAASQQSTADSVAQ